MREDHCGECGRPMPFTGSQLCPPCERDEAARDEAMFTCVCGTRVLFAWDTCSEECAELESDLLLSL